MKYPPMSISLQEDAMPICVTTDRRVPKHYEPESKKTITELLERQVIARRRTKAWWTPAFFVPKADDKRVRLVTDFAALNKFVQRPTHPFPSTREILEAIPPDAKLFCKRRCTRLLPTCAGREIQQVNDLPHTAGSFPIPQGAHGTELPLGRMVPDIIIRGLPYAMKIALLFGQKTKKTRRVSGNSAKMVQRKQHHNLQGEAGAGRQHSLRRPYHLRRRHPP